MPDEREREDLPSGHPDREQHKDPDVAWSARPGRPEEERFSEGQELEGDTAVDEQVGDFAEGLTTDAGEHKEEEARFSLGQEELPETPEKEEKGTFAEGQEVFDDDSAGSEAVDEDV